MNLLVEAFDSEMDVELLYDLIGGIIFGSHLATSHVCVVMNILVKIDGYETCRYFTSAGNLYL